MAGGVDRSPPPSGSAAGRMRAYRSARFISEHAKRRAERDTERQLDELDDATAGVSHEELAARRGEPE